MKQCTKCLSENITSIVEKNRSYFLCRNCFTKSDRIIDNDGQIFTIKENGLIKHVTVAAFIKQNNKYLFLNRIKYPFGVCFPTGHLHYNETLDAALKRKLHEETGFDLKSKQLIFHETIFDSCKNGGELHEWYLFDCSVIGEPIIPELDSKFIWVKKEDISSLDLVQPAKIILSKLGYLTKEDDFPVPTKIIEPENNNQKINTKDSIVDSLSVPIIVITANNKISFTNTVASSLLDHLSRVNNYENRLLVPLFEIAQKSIKSQSTVSGNIRFNNSIFNIVANALKTVRKINSVLTIKDITSQRIKEAANYLSYHSSLAICSNNSIKNIITSMLRQLANSLEIESCSLMLLSDNKLKVNFRYSKNLETKRKPLIFELGQGIAGWVAQNKAYIAIPNTSKNSLYIGRASKNEESLLSLPVISSGTVFGVLNLNKKANRYFSEEEIKIASVIANRIAMALENNNLYLRIEYEKKFLEKVLNSTTNGIAMINKDQKIVFANSNFMQNFDFTNQNQIVETLSLKIKNLTSEELEKIITDVFNQKNQIIKTCEIYSRQPKIFKVIFHPLSENGNPIENILIITNDISYEKQIERQQKEFIYTATHELRTPITAIKGYLSMILDGDTENDPAQQKKYFQRAYNSTEKLNQLVEDMLEAARLEENRVIFNMTSFHMAELIEDIFEDFKHKAKIKKIKLIYKKSKKQSPKVFADRDKLKQAISNLVDNAIKYTIIGAVTILFKQIDQGFLKLIIEDTGIGVAKKDQEKIFDKFFRVNSSESIKAGGTGLGLFIVKNLIEKQGGSIYLESKSKKGSSFNVLIPLAE
ncbi:MAG: ATP-binding protein [Patescibacteria group bacterium]|jgi:signal transduction histidine kinase/8-oxo-dGTP pyrophosphatase MutT (NUDIX family)